MSKILRKIGGGEQEEEKKTHAAKTTTDVVRIHKRAKRWPFMAIAGKSTRACEPHVHKVPGHICVLALLLSFSLCSMTTLCPRCYLIVTTTHLILLLLDVFYLPFLSARFLFRHVIETHHTTIKRFPSLRHLLNEIKHVFYRHTHRENVLVSNQSGQVIIDRGRLNIIPTQPDQLFLLVSSSQPNKIT